MGAQGTADLNFGAFPGSKEATVAVAESGVSAGSLVEAWMRPDDTTDHSADEHMVEDITVLARDIVAGVGFTIYGFKRERRGNERFYGVYKIAWVWN